MDDIIYQKEWKIYNERSLNITLTNNKYNTQFISNFMKKEMIYYDSYKNGKKNKIEKEQTYEILNLTKLGTDTIKIIMTFIFDNPKSHIRNIIIEYNNLYNEVQLEIRMLYLRYRKCVHLIEQEMDEIECYEKHLTKMINYLENEYDFFSKI